MEKEQNQTEEMRDKNPHAGQEVSAENIKECIFEELEKVVGIDKELLGSYVEFLGSMKAKDVEAMLKTLKKSLDEKLLPLLEMMAEHEQNTIAELGINRLGTIQSFKAAQLLSEINENHPDKKLRKAARKSLYKLKSVGIEIETTHKPLLGESKHQRYKCLVSPIDGTGTQLIMLTEEMLAGDLQLLQVVASDEKGIIDCSSRRGLTKNMFAKLPETFARQTGAEGPMLVEADYEFAMSLIIHAEAISEDAPDDYMSHKEFYGLTEAQPVENPVFQMLDAENLKEQPYFLRTSTELFQNDTFLSWHLPLNEMAQYAQELLDQDETEIELTPQFQQQRKEEVYQKVIETHCNEEFLKKLQRRLQLMAYIFMQQENEDDAKKALTAAVTLHKISGGELKNHPFLKELVLISLDAAEYVIEDGYNPAELDREEYIVGRDEEGNIVVQFVEG